MTPLETAVERLVAAYRDAGLPPIRPARAIEPALTAVRAEISPLQLPAELERFWRLIDPETITLAPYPRPISALYALESWKSHRDEFPGMTPRLLFPLAYESHGFLFIELEDGKGSGGAVFEWGYSGQPFGIQFPSLAAYIDLLATMIELGEFTRHADPHAWIEFDPDRRWEDAQQVRLTAALPLRGFGMLRQVEEDARHWPEHWLLSDGLTADKRTAHGATTTVEALLREAGEGRAARGTIHAVVTSLAASSAGRRISVDDGTGVLDVWCPSAVCTYGPIIRTEFEFDVVVQANPASPPDWDPEKGDAQRRALAHDLEGAQAAMRDLYAKAFETTAAAEATAIRPLD